MSENTNPPDDNQQKPKTGNSASHNPPPVAGAITEINIPESSPEQKTKDMEVHHHGHVREKKKWKEYIFQFVMLFAAVFLGSFAETTREDIGERHREKEYMESMVREIEKDTAEIGINHSLLFKQTQDLNLLQILFTHNLKKNKEEIKQCYLLTRNLIYFGSVNFNEATISQLISSGNMRIIEGRATADSIMGYYNYLNIVKDEKKGMFEFANLNLGALYKVFDVSHLRMQMKTADTAVTWADEVNWANIDLLTHDPVELKKLSAVIELTKLWIFNYIGLLRESRSKASGLINLLKSEYGIKTE